MHTGMRHLIDDALNYIEIRLTDKINLEEIARSFHLSKYHLHRLLSHAVGMPIMNYIRARKLSASLPLLLDDRLRIVDISNHFGFEHEQSYIRAFKKHFGITPRYPSWEERTFTYYTPSVQVSSFDDLPPGMESNLLAPSKYAVFTYVGSFHPKHLTIRHLEEIWSYIDQYAQLHNPGFRQSDLYHFEHIDESIATERYCEVGIYFPVQSLPQSDIVEPVIDRFA